MDGGPVVHGQVYGQGLTGASAVAQPNQQCEMYSWGSAALAWLYRQLCGASKKDVIQIGEAFLLVQLWAYSRFP